MKHHSIVLANLGLGRNIYAVHEGRQKNYSPYICDCYTAAYIAHGSGTLETGDSTVAIAEGDIFLIKPNLVHKFVPVDGIRRVDIYYCYFSFDKKTADLHNLMLQFPQLDNFWNGDEAFLHSVDTDNREIRDIFIRMIDEQLSSLPGSEEVILGYWYVMLTKLLRNTKTRDFTRVYSKNRIIDESVRFIHTNMYSKVSLDNLVEHLNVSPSYICRLFKKHIGMPPSQFINMIRVKKIEDILRNTDKPVEAVPEMFNCNVDYLKRVFKRETGMTMKEYRDKYHYKIASADE